EFGAGSMSRSLNFPVDVLLRFGAGMRGGAGERRADGLGVAPQRARGVHGLARLPFPLARGELGLGKLHADRAFDGIDRDDVAVLQQRDRAAQRGFGADMADAEAAR